MSDEFEVTRRKPTEQQAREADPYADQQAYFAKYEALRRQRIHP